MKKILLFFVAATLLLSFSLPAFAAGDPNIDHGGGGMGQGTGQNYWIAGMDGIRATIVDAKTRSPVTVPLDLTNQSPGTCLTHFGKVCKLSYNAGAGLSVSVGGYACSHPAQTLPHIIPSASLGASIQVIRSYFTDEQVLRALCGAVGFSYDTLITGDYRLLIEPIAYFTYGGVPFVMTATEAALYDQMIGGGLRAWMPSLTHKNLPLALYLEKADLGYPAWTGSKTQKVTDAQILSSLGLGLVRFTDKQDDTHVTINDYEYRVDTDVITSVVVSGGQSDPDNPVTVYFTIEDTTYTVSNVYYPSGGRQLAWVKWHTSKSPKLLTIGVTVSGGGSAKGTITANIVDLSGHDPPNPVADDRCDGFTVPTVPQNAQTTQAEWNVWVPRWHANWVWVSDGDDGGWWVDEGWWEFDASTCSASLTADMAVSPDALSPTASASTMRSGYGVQQKTATIVSTNQSAAVTTAQNALTFFPEFKYGTYWRLLEPSVSGKSTTFTFRANPYSTYGRRTHFTPVWYPDGSYTLYTRVIDCWTPAGMLSADRTDGVALSGSLWDDWHIAPARPT